jgi:hypothetical protein
MKQLADLEVTTKSVERTAEAIGADIAQEERQTGKAVQLDLPVVVGQPIPILYVQMGRDWRADGEEGVRGAQRQNRRPARPHAKPSLGCMFTQTTWDQEDYPDSRSGFHHLNGRHRSG